MQAEDNIQRLPIPPIIERLTAAAGDVGIAGGAVFVWLFDPNKSNFFPVCPLFTMTGFACPGCGMTRGFHELFHGRLISAIDFNLLVPFWAVILGYVWISLLLMMVRGRGLPMWPTYPKFLWIFLIVLFAFGVLRNIPVWPLTILYP